MFTAYIFIILSFTIYIPCSCGGVLETMGWTEHLVFNLFFVAMASIGVLTQLNTAQKKEDDYKLGDGVLFRRYFIGKPLASLGFLSFASICLLILLFLISEKQFRTNNSFVRRFPGKPVQKINQLNLGLNSYYLAGAANGKIFLGNNTAPLHVLVLDTLAHKKYTAQISLVTDSLKSRSTQLRVFPPYFFLLDGSVPFVFRGNISNWKGEEVPGQGFYFSMVQPIDFNRLAIRGVSTTSSSNVLGTVLLSENHRVTLSHKLLQKQVDGIFDTDGILLYNPQIKKLVYTYYYCNEFIVANEKLELDYRGNTIDTISRVNIEVAYIKSKKQRKLAAPPLLVNKYAATYGNYLFVNSKLPGRYETRETWSKNSIIDVYNLVDDTYEFSFKIQDINGEKLKMFLVTGQHFIGLIGNHMVAYKLHEYTFKK